MNWRLMITARIRFAIFAGSLILASGALSGCAVGMAASGQPGPNLAACRVGAERTDIERELGTPINVETTSEGGVACTYRYEVGDEPSAGRAVAHAGLDVLTFGLWEIVGAPIEAVQGDQFEMKVVYGPDGRAQTITTRKLETFE